MMDKKTFAIGVLSVVAVVLMAANMLTVQPAEAATSIKDRDYQLATARSNKGGETLFVIDNRTGTVAAMVWDNQTRSMRPMAVDSLANLFK